jgi:hypothetical protein
MAHRLSKYRGPAILGAPSTFSCLVSNSQICYNIYCTLFH